MVNRIWTAGAAACLMMCPIAAHASVFTFNLNGPGVSGTLNITYEIDTNTAPVLDASPNEYDPVGSYIITGVTGTFSDMALGLTDARVTSLVPVNYALPEPSNLRAPNRFSLLPVANGVEVEGGIVSPGLHFDNIFYPGGSPQTATDYPFSGGVFDIYGIAFTIDSGDSVNFWSNGAVPGAGLNYGVAVTDGIDVRDYTGGVTISAVPEPASWAMLIIGFATAGGAMRRRRRVAIRVGFV